MHKDESAESPADKGNEVPRGRFVRDPETGMLRATIQVHDHRKGEQKSIPIKPRPEKQDKLKLPFDMLLPDLSPDEYEALKQSIKENGLLVPLLVDFENGLIDGYHRYRAITELRAEGKNIELTTTRPDCLRDVSKREKVAYLVNLQRRHLTPEQRADLTVKLKGEGLSNRQIAQALQVDEKTTRNDLKAAGAEKSAPARVTGKDGKSYPATKPKTKPTVTAAIPSVEPAPASPDGDAQEPVKLEADLVESLAPAAQAPVNLERIGKLFQDVLGFIDNGRMPEKMRDWSTPEQDLLKKVRSLLCLTQGQSPFRRPPSEFTMQSTLSYRIGQLPGSTGPRCATGCEEVSSYR